MSEIWRTVVDYEKLYEVSNLGNFRRISSGRPIAVTVSPKNGYGYVHLSQKGVATNHRANRLVLLAHKGPPSNPKDEARHLNGVRNDNRLSNLAWGSAKQNKADQIEHGRAYSHFAANPGEKHPNAKLRDADIVYIRNLFARGWTQKGLAAIFGTTQSNISRIVSGKSRL